ncbi:MAG: hypothetical protein AAGF01_16040 [Cyanobacteria bacterium P01_G01_bin.38]
MKAWTRWYGMPLLLMVGLLPSCVPESVPESPEPIAEETTNITAGTAAERISQIEPILVITLPSDLQDAYFIETRIGTDSRLAPGPSDYRSYYRLQIEPASVELWRQVLDPLEETPPTYDATGRPDWWVTAEKFEQLEFYKPESLTQRINGWIGLHPETGEIYIFTYTT